MRYLALVCDYDGSLASEGKVDGAILAALERVLASGRKLILVTGRQLPDLLDVFPEIGVFEWIVAENGALLYQTSSRQEKLLADPPAEQFIGVLRDRGVEPLSVGRVIVSTQHPQETVVLEVIRDLRLDLQIIFNKGSVMVLPSGVDKGSGLQSALSELCLSPHNVVGIGDAENDLAFLRLCGCSVAVANALPMLKEQVDMVTIKEYGAGAAELVEKLVGNDLQDCERR